MRVEPRSSAGLGGRGPEGRQYRFFQSEREEPSVLRALLLRDQGVHPHELRRFRDGALAGEHRRQTDLIVQSQILVHHRPSQIGFHDDDPLARQRQADAKVHGRDRLAFLGKPARNQDGVHVAIDVEVLEARAQRPK